MNERPEPIPAWPLLRLFRIAVEIARSSPAHPGAMPTAAAVLPSPSVEAVKAALPDGERTPRRRGEEWMIGHGLLSPPEMLDAGQGGDDE